MEDVLNQILSELQKVNTRLDGLENGQRNLEQRMEKLAKEQKETIDNMVTEMRSHFRHLESKLDQHQKVFGVVSDKVRDIEYNIDFLSEKTGKHDMQINSIQRTLKASAGE
jgi:chromosome segregation ATPase